MRPALLLLVLLGCSGPVPEPIDEVDPCAQYVDSVYGCDTLAAPVIEPLLPLPADTVTP